MKYLYYKLWQDFTGNVKDNSPAFLSMVWLSVIQGSNILTIQVLIEHFFNIKFNLDSKNTTIIFATSVCVILYLVNYFLLYKKRDSISARYKSESKRMKVIGLMLLYTYMIGSFIIVYFVSTRLPLK